MIVKVEPVEVCSDRKSGVSGGVVKVEVEPVEVCSDSGIGSSKGV